MSEKRKPLDIYQPEVLIKSMFLGVESEYKKVLEGCDAEPELVKAFWLDNEIQYLKVASGNLGLIKEFQKQYKPKEITNDKQE